MSRIPSHFNQTGNDYNRLLASAALFDGDFSIDWLEELSGMKASQILLVLHQGINLGDLTAKAPGVFCFADLKGRQRWQAHLPSEEKERMHRRIAEFLLMELPDDDTKAVAAAPHLLNISIDEQKCRWLMRAGDVYRKSFRIEEALQCYTKAIDTLSGLQGEEIDSLFIEAAIAYSKISTARHDTTKVISILNEALIRAIKWDKKNYEALLKMHLAKNEWLCSRYRSARRYFEQGWSMAKKIDDSKLLRSATTFSTFFLYWQGRFKEAVSLYEKSVSEVDKYPQGRFPLLAAIIVGRCYAHIGRTTQALGMLDGIREHCRKRGDLYLSSHAAGSLGATLLEIGRVDDAIQHLQSSMEDASQGHNDWVKVWVTLTLAFSYYLKEDHKQAIAYLLEFLQRGRSVQVTVRFYPYLMELLWAMEQGRLPHVPALSLSKEVSRMIRNENVFLKGVAYKFQALLQRRKGLHDEEIMKSLKISLDLLEESGDLFELAKSHLESAREYLLRGNEGKAREATLTACKILPSFHKSLVPEDLRFLIKESSKDQDKTLLNEILRLGREVVTIRDNKELVQQIISAVNQITGAERGAIFLLEKDGHSPRLRLRASKNLTSEQIAHPTFNSSMKMIEETALSGKGRILGMGSRDRRGSLPSEMIRSRICVPMIFRDKVVGVLYHDNRLFSSLFKESDLELLSYFSAQAAIALDNARAYEEINRLNQKLQEEKLYYEEEHIQNLHFEDIVGESPAIINVLAQMDQVAKTDSTVLILGETGVGKELVARAIHRHSHRQNKPFIRVFCSALPDSLIPSELFGHEKGAFTGAINRRIGRFELADGGTLFLDEIGDLPLEVQVRLLRVLQSKEFERVGGNETLRSDFRLLVATNRDLEEAVKAGKFRPDLYYRLNVFPIYVPPLQERKEDIPLLANYFLKLYATKMGKTLEKIPKLEMDKLIQYDWPGNVRELENIMERGTIVSPGPFFRVPELGMGRSETGLMKKDITLSDNERRHILWALQRTGWKVRGLGGAADLLQIHPSTLAFRMKKLGIQRPPDFSRRRREWGQAVNSLS